MSDAAILRALGELDRWTRRRDELLAQLQIDGEAAASMDELAKAQRQVAYYEALAQDMKRQTRPAGIGDLLSSLIQP